MTREILQAIELNGDVEAIEKRTKDDSVAALIQQASDRGLDLTANAIYHLDPEQLQLLSNHIRDRGRLPDLDRPPYNVVTKEFLIDEINRMYERRGAVSVSDALRILSIGRLHRILDYLSRLPVGEWIEPGDPLLVASP